MTLECKHCKSNNIIIIGTVRTRFDVKQIYLCKDCGKHFFEFKEFSRYFEHNGLAYNFNYHKAKLDLLCSSFPSLDSYIKRFEIETPKFFYPIQNRCSQLKVNVNIRRESKQNLACKLADLALKTGTNSKERNSVVENFMIINDTCTIACEVPIWFWEKNLGQGISGRIDILQVRRGRIFILNYKPQARKGNWQKVASQLYLYAFGLSFRTRIPLEKFRCAWFDDKDYYEFNPKEAKLRFPGSKCPSVAGSEWFTQLDKTK